MKTNSYIIRHAQSLANAWFATKNTKTIWLSDQWKQEAKQLAKNRDKPIDKIIHSKYDRTLLTAQPLIDKLWDQTKIIQNELIHEFTFLDSEIFSNTTPEQRKPYRENFWKQSVDYQHWKNSESFAAFMTRVGQFANIIKSWQIKNSAIFSHEQFMMSLLYILSSEDNLSDLSYTKKQIHDILYIQKKWIDNTQIISIDDII